MTTTNSEWLDRIFSYWKPELVPVPRQVMADLKANKTRNFNAILDKYGITDPEKRFEAEWVLETFMIESGDMNLHFRYGWLGTEFAISEDGKVAVQSKA